MISLPVESRPCNTPSRVMKNIEPSVPPAIRPRNSDPGSKVHIRMPALRADRAGVLDAAGSSNASVVGVAVGVAVAVGASGTQSGQVSTSTYTPTPTNWLLTPEPLLAWIQAHPASPVV